MGGAIRGELAPFYLWGDTGTDTTSTSPWLAKLVGIGSDHAEE